MHCSLTRRRDESGAVAIIVAVSATVLLVVAAMVVDFGLVRVDRQVDKSAADAATIAGLHALNGGDADPRPFVGVCTAIRYLSINSSRFAAMTDTSGVWTNGLGATRGNGCTDATLRSQVCASGPASWARFTWNGTLEGKALNVVIQSGYLLTGTGFSEDALPAADADKDDSAAGCNQLAVIINQRRDPGLGSLATSSDLITSVRSVGRVRSESGGYAPAMLLLEQTTCPVLESGSNNGTSFVHVLGDEASDGKTQPGTIHSDSAASSNCSGGTNQNIFLGKGTDGIVAYAAPVSGSPGTADPTKPGQITAYAGSVGKALNYIIDNAGSLSSAYAAAGVGPAAPGTHAAPSGSARVTRKPVDLRYFSGVKGAIATAESIFSSVTASSAGWIPLNSAGPVDACKPTQAQLNALSLSASSRLYINCTGTFIGAIADLSINAGTIVFAGSVAPKQVHSLPNATHVYIRGSATDSLNIGNNSAFKVHTAGLLSGGSCTNARSSNKALVVVRDGAIKESGTGQLQLCNTTLIMMGGRYDGCVPGAAGAAPSATPCATSPSPTAGTGGFDQQGGSVDWTAPDALDLTTTANGEPTSAAITAWQDQNGPEDLAFWSESAGGGYQMTGSGQFRIRGVFMVPNATPFKIGGTAALTLTDAQFIARTVALNGANTRITMSVDANAAVTLPRLALVGLVR